MDELDKAEIEDSLHPKRVELLTTKSAFSKPARPGRGRPGTPK